jgi:hypothetical protein
MALNQGVKTERINTYDEAGEWRNALRNNFEMSARENLANECSRDRMDITKLYIFTGCTATNWPFLEKYERFGKILSNSP